MKIRSPSEALRSVGIEFDEHKSDLDSKLQQWLEDLATENGKTIEEFAKEFAKDEIENKKETLPKIKEILEQKPINLKQLRIVTKENYVGGEHWMGVKLAPMWDHEKSSQMFNDCIENFPDSEPQQAQRIDKFVDELITLSVDETTGTKLDLANAKLFASVILSSLYPDKFVDFRKSRWKNLARVLGISAFEDKNQNEIIEATRIAKQISETSTFKKYWGTENTLQIVASICWMVKDNKSSTNDVDKYAKLILESGKFALAIDVNIVKRVLRHLNAGKHVILVGAPGVGKTELAKRILEIYGKLKTGNDYLLSVATAEWTGKDVIGANDLKGNFQPGWVTKACKERKWLLIDEFNRADINKAFGEMFLAIEDKKIPLKEEWIGEYSSGDISIPDEFRMICTMNDFDKNLLLTELSYGLITRFAFVDIHPDSTLEQESVRTQVVDNELISEDNYEKCKNQITSYFDFINKVREVRMIGVRTSIDIIRYVTSASKESSEKSQLWKYLDEALCDYLLPQFERLDRLVIDHVLKSTQEKLKQVDSFTEGITTMKKDLERMINIFGSEIE